MLIVFLTNLYDLRYIGINSTTQEAIEQIGYVIGMGLEVEIEEERKS